MTSRIHRGFHRIGVVLAGLMLLLDLLAVVTNTIKASFALTLIVLAVFLYAAARAIGWILDGFLSPGPRP